MTQKPPKALPYQNEFIEGPKRPPHEVKAEILRRRARAKAIKDQNGRVTS